MSKLDRIPGLEDSAVELLEVAGFTNVETLAKANVDGVTRELKRANDMLRIVGDAPTRGVVYDWVRAARELTGLDEEVREKRPVPVNFEGTDEVREMLATAPLAIPLPARQLIDRQLAVNDIPPAILMNRYSGDLDVRVTDRKAGEKAAPKVQVANLEQGGLPRLELDPAKVRSFSDVGVVPKWTINPEQNREPDRVSLLKAPRERTNRGKNPSSRRYIRGVLHGHPIRLAMAALITLVLVIVMPSAIVSAGLLLASDLDPERFSWVPKWLLAFPLALPIVGLGYLTWGLSGKCRICGQRLFWPRNCRKNTKAHHLPGMGHIVPLSIHLLLFRWFRCTYCGTSVRIKE